MPRTFAPDRTLAISFAAASVFLHAAANDASICSEVNHGPSLSTSDGSRSSRDEQDTVGFMTSTLVSAPVVRERTASTLTEDAIRPDVAQVLRPWDSHAVLEEAVSQGRPAKCYTERRPSLDFLVCDAS